MCLLTVPRTGLEPARIAPHAPQACLSTNFNTSARRDELRYRDPFAKLQDHYRFVIPPLKKLITLFCNRQEREIRDKGIISNWIEDEK